MRKLLSALLLAVSLAVAPAVAQVVHNSPASGVQLKLSDFASTTSAQLAGVISDETGTGKVVFSDSPSFTGTVIVDTLRTARIGAGLNASATATLSAPTLLGGTNDRDAYLVVVFYESGTDTHAPGLYLVTKKGTQNTVSTIVSATNIAVGVNGSNQITFTNNTGGNGAIIVNVLRVSAG